jgi:hypothetical protein
VSTKEKAANEKIACLACPIACDRQHKSASLFSRKFRQQSRRASSSEEPAALPSSPIRAVVPKRHRRVVEPQRCQLQSDKGKHSASNVVLTDAF